MFILLLSGLFCCLGFSVVVFFCCLGGGGGGGRGGGRVFVFAVWRVACFCFCCLGGWRVFVCSLGGCIFFCLLFGRVAFFFFCLLFGRVACFCLLFGRLRFFFCLLLGRVACLFFAVWAGGYFFLLFGRGSGVHSLTGLPGSSSSDPATKKTKQPKKKTRVPIIGSIISMLVSIKRRPQHKSKNIITFTIGTPKLTPT